MNRVEAILTAYDALPEPKEDIHVYLYDVMDAGNNDATPLHRVIRDSFQSDDDFDDLVHTIDHALGECTEDSDDCEWGMDD